MKSSAYVVPASFAVLMHGALFFNGTPGTHDFVGEVSTVSTEWIEFDPLPMLPSEPPEDIVAVVSPETSSNDQSDIPAPVFEITSLEVATTCLGKRRLPEIPPTEIGVIIQTIQTLQIGDTLGDGTVGPRHTGPIGVAGLDKTPETRLQVPPRYPHDMRRQGREGSVNVEFVVNRQGRVISATADARAPREFARAAEDAVRRWKFEPGRRNGQLVSFRMTVPIVFSLDRI
jgi:protein TonB